MMKIQMKSILNYAIGSAFYMILMVWIYPSIAVNTKSLNEFVKVMPESLLKAFGFENGFGSFESFISGEYYGVILTIILTIFVSFFQLSWWLNWWIKAQWPIYYQLLSQEERLSLLKLVFSLREFF